MRFVELLVRSQFFEPTKRTPRKATGHWEVAAHSGDLLKFARGLHLAAFALLTGAALCVLLGAATLVFGFRSTCG